MRLLKSNNSRLVFFVIVTSVLLLIRDVGNYNINKFVFVGICAISFAIADVPTIAAAVSFVFPLLYGLPGNYIMPLALIFYVIKRKRITAIQFGYIVFVAVMEMIALRNYSNIQIEKIAGYGSVACLFFIFIYENTIEYKKCLRLFTFGITVLCVIDVAETIVASPSNWISMLSSGYFRFGYVEDIGDGLRISLNANALSFLSITGISIILVLLQENKKFLILYCELAILILSGALTLSRTYFIVGILCIAYYIFSVGKNNKSILKGFGIVAVVFFFFFVVYRYIPTLPSGVLARFERSDLLTGNNRIEIFSAYWKAFWNSLSTIMLGTGVTQYSSVLGLTGKSIHNGILQLLVCYGLPGFCIFLHGWLKPVFCSIKKVDMVFFLPFLCTFIYVQTAQFVNPHVLLAPHLFSIFSLYYGRELSKDRIANECYN